MKDGAAPPGADQPVLADADGSPVVLLEAALWQRLGEAANRDEVTAAWLALQCRMVSGAKAGLLVFTAEDGAAEAVVRWPDSGEGGGVLRSAALLAAKERRGVLTDGRAARSSSDPGTAIAYPVIVDDVVHGAVAILVAGNGEADVRAAMRQIQWGVAWIRDWLRKEGGEHKERARAHARQALELLGTVLDPDRFHAAAVAAVTELALLSDSERVSVGFRRRGSTVIKAISHVARFGRKMDLVRALAAAMDEAIDQRSIVHVVGFGTQAGDAAEDDEPLATRANDDLARSLGGANVLTVPVLVHDRFALAFTLERRGEHGFHQHEVDLVATVAAAVGPILEEKRQNDRWIGFKLADTLGRGVVRLAGPGNLVAKLSVAAGLAIVGFLAFAETDYRVNASARVEGVTRRAVVAPSDGFIREANARAGDTVAEGDLLAALEDRDLVLERMRWITERQQRELEYQNALAARERSKASIVKTQIAQAEAQIRLVDELIVRTRFVAPFDALVVSGDLSQSISAAVSRGQVLFELAPLEGYRVDLYVDESQIADVSPGDTGQVLVSSLPDRPFAFTVDKITSVSEQREGRNVFKVEGRLSEVSPGLRPGMDGVAKVDIGRRHLVWVWTRPLIDWVKVQSWRWLP